MPFAVASETQPAATAETAGANAPTHVPPVVQLEGGRPALPMTMLDLAVVFALTLVVGLAVYKEWVPHSHLHGDGAAYALNAETFWQTGGFRVEGFHARSWYDTDLGWNRNLDSDFSNVARDIHGGWRPKHPILLPIVASPVLAAFGPLGLLAFNVLGVVLCLFGGYRLARRLLPHAGPAPPLLGLMALAPWPIFMSEANGFSNDVFYSALLVWGVERTVAGKISVGGLLLGLGVFAKQTNLLIAAPLGLWLLFDVATAGRRMRFVLACALPVLAIAILDTLWFGAPHVTGYSRVLTRTNNVATLTDHVTRFAKPSLQGLERLWATDARGLRAMFPVAPMLLVAPLLALRGGLPRWFLLAMFVAASAHAAFLAGYDYTHARFFAVLAVLGVSTVGSGLHELGRLTAFALGGREAARPALLDPAPALRLRRSVPALLIAAVVGAFAAGFWSHAVPARWRLSEHLREAKVELQAASGPVPCDHFNHYHQKWECRSHETLGWSMWGHAVDDQCQVGGRLGPQVWVHAQSRMVAKTLTIPLPPGVPTIVLQAALSDAGHKPHAIVRFYVDDKLVWRTTVTEKGAVRAQEVPGGKSLRIEVPGQPNELQQLCVDAVSKATGPAR